MALKCAFISLLLICCLLQQHRSNASFSTKEPFNRFSLDVFNKVAETNEDKNVLISPLYIRYILTLAYLGARGTTALELEQTLAIDRAKYKEDVATDLATYVRNAKQSGGKLTLFNRLLVNKSETVSNKFRNLAKIVDCQISKVNFRDIKIKGFNNTQGTFVAVQNSISLEAQWYYALQDVGKKGFISPQSNEVLHVDYMGIKGWYRHYRSVELKAHFLQMNFKNHKMAMIFILPDDIDGLAEVEHKLVRTDLDKILNSMIKSRIILYMPKFNISTLTGLERPLQRLGVNSLYNGGADFGDLIVDAQVPVSLSVRHFSNLFIDNKGLRESSNADVEGEPYQQHRELHFNHPFAYFIRTSDSILFAGHLVNPKKTKEKF